MQSTYSSAAQGLHEEAPSDEILAAFELLKKQRSAVEERRMQVALSLEGLTDEERRQKVAEDAANGVQSEFARLLNPCPTD